MVALITDDLFSQVVIDDSAIEVLISVPLNNSVSHDVTSNNQRYYGAYNDCSASCAQLRIALRDDNGRPEFGSRLNHFIAIG